MLFWICIGIVVMVYLYCRLSKNAEAANITIFVLGMCGLVVMTVMIIAAALTDNKVTVWEMDTSVIENEVYDGTNHYHTTVDGEDFKLPTGNNVEFVIDDANTITKECDYVPDWVLPWDMGQCNWTIEAERVE